MSFLKRLFGGQQKLSVPINLGVLQTDMHSHFIPGIDDGAPTLEASLELVTAMHALGYRKVITTPHIMSDSYRNGAHNILPGLQTVREVVAQSGLDMVLEAAAEYYIDADLEDKIRARDILSFGSNYVLFEMPFVGEPANLGSVIFELQLAGYKPVMAHVERYPFWQNDFNKIIDLRDKGVLLQVNISSFTGYYSPGSKKIAEKLADEKMIDLLGSDCHHTGHIQLIQQACYLPHLEKAINHSPLLNASL